MVPVLLEKKQQTKSYSLKEQKHNIQHLKIRNTDMGRNKNKTEKSFNFIDIYTRLDNMLEDGIENGKYFAFKKRVGLSQPGRIVL